ncbi:CMD domain-containing protein [Curtobacterium sp. USHLN213]|uniref:CMD domain-containing protein n=1 Tax=Curtobacterium sp. USHLN213 TaxID=3081255 RepID=UPI003017D29F
MTGSADVIDDVLEIGPGDDVWQVRRERPEVLAHLQGAYDSFFGPTSTTNGLSRSERIAAAVAICRAAEANALADYYESLTADDHDPVVRERVVSWAALVARDPQSSTASDVAALRDAGLGDPEIITLAQLIGFVSFQLRVVIGLEMMEI